MNPDIERNFHPGKTIKIFVSKKSKTNNEILNHNWYTIDNSIRVLNVKKSKEINSKVLFRLRNGQNFQVVDYSHKKWWKIIFKNTVGFVNSHKIIKIKSNNE